jgi:pantothenate synthetase
MNRRRPLENNHEYLVEEDIPPMQFEAEEDYETYEKHELAKESEE